MIYVSLDESDCALSSVQEINAEEFEDKEWTFVIEAVCIMYFIILCLSLCVYLSTNITALGINVNAPDFAQMLHCIRKSQSSYTHNETSKCHS